MEAVCLTRPARQRLEIWLPQECVEWLRQTRNYASINLRAAELVEEAWRRNQGQTGRYCACGCFRLVYGRQVTATPACRQRLRRARLSRLSVTPAG